MSRTRVVEVEVAPSSKDGGPALVFVTRLPIPESVCSRYLGRIFVRLPDREEWNSPASEIEFELVASIQIALPLLHFPLPLHFLPSSNLTNVRLPNSDHHKPI